MHNKDFLWVEKYRPVSITDYIFHDEIFRKKVNEFISTKTLPHLILSGPPGSGKTTIAKILFTSLNIDPVDILVINASSKKGIDTIRDEVLSFASTTPIGNFKILHLEEGDRLTIAAQDAMKDFMETSAEYVKVIVTCNNVNLLTPAFRSRCQEFKLQQSSVVDVSEYLITVLANENVQFDLEQIDELVNSNYPDVRKIVNTAQQYTIDNVLVLPSSLGNIDSDVTGVIRRCITSSDWNTLREYLITTEQSVNWVDVFKDLYRNLHLSINFPANSDNWESGIIAIANALYNDAFVADHEINGVSLLIQLNQITKSRKN